MKAVILCADLMPLPLSTPLLTSMDRYEAAPLLRKPTEGQDIVADYRSTGLTLERHPLCLLRRHLDRYRYTRAADLAAIGDGRLELVHPLGACPQIVVHLGNHRQHASEG